MASRITPISYYSKPFINDTYVILEGFFIFYQIHIDRDGAGASLLNNLHEKPSDW